MKKTQSNVGRAINTVKLYHKRYGFNKAIRTIFHFGYRGLQKFNPPSTDEPLKINQSKMYLIPNDAGISSELMMFKSHEPITTKLFSKELYEGMTCLDVGSNIGYYVLLESRLVGDTGRIISIEPSPTNFKYLEKNLALQNNHNVECYNFAAGDKEGKVRFFVNNKSNGCKVLREGQVHPHEDLGTIIEVPVRTLDNLVDELELSRLDLIRMDVEGYELHILKGMKQILKKFQPQIQLELHKRQLGIDGTKEFFEIIQELGYDVQYYIPRDLDIPIIGSINDVKKYNISKLLELLETNKLTSYLMLTFKPINKIK